MIAVQVAFFKLILKMKSKSDISLSMSTFGLFFGHRFTSNVLIFVGNRKWRTEKCGNDYLLIFGFLYQVILYFSPLSYTTVSSPALEVLSECWYRCYCFTPGRGAKYCDEYICLSVHSHISKFTRPNFTKFVGCCMRSWLDPSLMAMRMYFSFCGWRHDFTVGCMSVFLSGEGVTAETTASIPTKLCSTINIR